MAEEYGQKALLRNVAKQNEAAAEIERMKREKEEAERKRIEEKRRFWSVVREWITIALGLMGTVLSIISLLWQAPLH